MLQRTRSVLQLRFQAAAGLLQIPSDAARFATETAKSGKFKKNQAAAKPTAKAADADSGKGDPKFQLMLKALTPAEVEDVDVPPELRDEHERRAKEYSRKMMAEHRAWQRDLTRKLQLKNEAIAALPPYLQAAALEEDLTPFPMDRLIPTHTPPVKGFARGSTRSKSG